MVRKPVTTGGATAWESSRPGPGSQWTLTVKMNSRISPDQKTGIEEPSSAKSLAA